MVSTAHEQKIYRIFFGFFVLYGFILNSFRGTGINKPVVEDVINDTEVNF